MSVPSDQCRPSVPLNMLEAEPEPEPEAGSRTGTLTGRNEGRKERQLQLPLPGSRLSRIKLSTAPCVSLGRKGSSVGNLEGHPAYTYPGV